LGKAPPSGIWGEKPWEDLLPGTQITLVLIGKDLVFGSLSLKMGDKQVPGVYKGLYTIQLNREHNKPSYVYI